MASFKSCWPEKGENLKRKLEINKLTCPTFILSVSTDSEISTQCWRTLSEGVRHVMQISALKFQLSAIQEPKTLFAFCEQNNIHLCFFSMAQINPYVLLMTFKQLYLPFFRSQNTENLIANRLASLEFCDFHLIEF